tara:strand:+ start:11121 stop:11366 length:246 start_codon:yes stop_codon:yes gene_type:complete
MGGIGKALGTISPLAGALSGKGLFGKLLGTDEARKLAEATDSVSGAKGKGGKAKKMAKGGSTGKPRGCGIAKRGHGKVRMF